MGKKIKLLAALDAHKGRDPKVTRQKEILRKARKRTARATGYTSENSTETAAGPDESLLSKTDYDNWESDKSDDVAITNDLCTISAAAYDKPKYKPKYKPTESDGKVKTGIILGRNTDKDGDINSELNRISLSDLEAFSENEEVDIVPYQYLTINNISALIKAQKAIAFPLSNVLFSEHQSVISAAQTSIPDINDDLNREIAFYKQSLDAVNEARSLLNSEGIAFTRPTDYFAEMVKTDEHMGKIKQKMADEAANKKAAAEARKQRDLKKFGKQVQVSKLQERDKSKREMLEKMNILKRKRRNTEILNTQEEDLFDVALEDINKTNRPRNTTEDGHRSQVQNKRQRKDANFGFGGKKRFLKSGNALSSGDIGGFSAKKMKGKSIAAPRLGKSRRTKLA